MIRGIYTAASGMIGDAARLDVIANNLANVNTPGFKRDLALYRAMPDMPIIRHEATGFNTALGSLATGAFLENTYPSTSQGPLRRTGVETDIALLGHVYLAVETPFGERYTRHGGLVIDADGLLLTASGHAVMGDDGTLLRVTGSEPVRIGEEGTVYRGDDVMGRLRLVEFTDPAGLLKEGDNLLAANERSGPAQAAPQGRVAPGFLEESNVDPVREMVAMITVMRAYEANQQVIKAQDEALQRGITVGRLA